MKCFDAKSEHDASTKDGPNDAPAPTVAEPGGFSLPIVDGLAHGTMRRSGGQSDDPLGGTRVGPDVDTALSRLRGGGQPLPEDIAQPMGQAMGADLSDVRIHTGDEPAALARSVQATAFTVGRDIFFGAGRYAPDSPSGQRLLAHELAHTVQDDGGGSGAGPVIGRVSDPAEAEADRVADSVLRTMRRQASAPEEAAADEAPRHAPGNRLRRKVGFEAELMVPSLGDSANQLTYNKEPGKVTADIKSFLDGGVEYGTDIGGKKKKKGKKAVDVRLDSDHGGSIDRGPLVDALKARGYVSGEPFEPATKIEFVTRAVEELAPGADAELDTVITALTDLMDATLTQAKSGSMEQLGAPAKAGYRTGIPRADLKNWWAGDPDQDALDKLVDDYLKKGIKDDVYLQATVGVIPSAMMKFFERTSMTGGNVEVEPPSAARKQILEIVREVVADLETKFAAEKEDHWVQQLGPASRESFLGLLGLAFSYCLADTLHQTSAGTLSTVKNAVPFLIKMSPYGLLAETATHQLKDKPPPTKFVRKIGDDFKKSKYLQLDYWLKQSRWFGRPTAVGDKRLPAKLDARPTKERLVTGSYTDFVESMILGTGGDDVRVVVGKELPGPDKPPTDSGGVNVFWELFDQQAIPIEYRAITKRYKISEVGAALREIVDDVRRSNMSGLTDEQRAKVKEAYES